MPSHEEGFWWEKEIPRRQAEIDDLKMQLAQLGTYSPESAGQEPPGQVPPKSRRKRLREQITVAEGEPDNARRAAEAHAASEGDAKRRKSDSEVAKRRALVRANPGLKAREMCVIFDRHSVALPPKWLVAGYDRWGYVYKVAQYRSKIDSLISKDRHKN